jgi:hypothetical protein
VEPGTGEKVRWFESKAHQPLGKVQHFRLSAGAKRRLSIYANPLSLAKLGIIGVSSSIL